MVGSARGRLFDRRQIRMAQPGPRDLDQHLPFARTVEVDGLDAQRAAVGVGARQPLLVENRGGHFHGSLTRSRGCDGRNAALPGNGLVPNALASPAGSLHRRVRLAPANVIARDTLTAAKTTFAFTPARNAIH
jgi:hypothetical protein